MGKTLVRFVDCLVHKGWASGGDMGHTRRLRGSARRTSPRQCDRSVSPRERRRGSRDRRKLEPFLARAITQRSGDCSTSGNWGIHKLQDFLTTKFRPAGSSYIIVATASFGPGSCDANGLSADPYRQGSPHVHKGEGKQRGKLGGRPQSFAIHHSFIHLSPEFRSEAIPYAGLMADVQ